MIQNAMKKSKFNGKNDVSQDRVLRLRRRPALARRERPRAPLREPRGGGLGVWAARLCLFIFNGCRGHVGGAES